jgi:hypothetical protein
VKEFLLDSTRFAVSAHNSQPFRFRFEGSRILVFVASDSHLPAADPTEKDLRMSLGALFETWDISLSAQNFQISLLQGPTERAKDNETYAIFDVQQSERRQDPLYACLDKRFSYRGKFSEIIDTNILKQQLVKFGFRIVQDSKDKQLTAQLYNKVNLKFLLKKGYVEELYSWMRFSKKDDRWSKDGLNSESLALSLIESAGASVVLKPKVFRFLNKLNMAGVLVDEADKITSAPFLVAIPAPKDTSDFEKGRLFLRFWLKLTDLGLFGAPLSLLTDSEEAVETLKPVFGLSSSEDFVNILRVGRLPKNYSRYEPARLSTEELCV